MSLSASIRVENVETWRKVGGTNVLILFTPVSMGARDMGPYFLSIYIGTQDRGQSFDDTSGSPMWKRVFQGCYLSSFDSFESGPTCFAFHSLMRHSISSAGVDELSVIPIMCIWASLVTKVTKSSYMHSKALAHIL